MSDIRILHKSLVLLFFLFTAIPVYAGTITLSTDSSNVQAGEAFRFILTAEGSFKSIEEPSFTNFGVENRSESQSSSISIINGKMESKKTINYIYILRADKAGVFKVGPASMKLDNGKKIDSNIVTVTVTTSMAGDPAEKTDEFSNDAALPTSNSLLAPLSTWEKKTSNSFLRAVVKPSGEVFEGEPLVVKYYLFTKPGSISDVNFYKMPTFENCWKEERSETRLSFKRGAIGGVVYDYALVATYFLIPEKDIRAVTATQMILDVMTGSFFNTRKQSISTPALNIPLNPLPDKENHQNGLFGNVTVTTDRKKIILDKENLLETVTYTISGCGNLNHAEIKLMENPALNIFSPEIDLNAGDSQNGYCGQKKYKFMIKGLRTGKTSLVGRDLNFYSKEKGWEKIEIPQTDIDIKDISASSDSVENRTLHNFELLKELPKGIKTYEITPLVKRTWFRTVLIIPFAMVILSFFIWLFKSILQKRSKSYQTRLSMWKEKLTNAMTMNELLNNFYDALKELFGIELRGERRQNLKRKYADSIEDILEFIKEIEHSSYSIDGDANLSGFKSKAVGFLNFRGKKK